MVESRSPYLTRASVKRKCTKEEEARKAAEKKMMELGDEVQEAGVVVLPSEELTLLEDVEEAEIRLIHLLHSAEWLDQYEATTLVRQLVLFHRDNKFVVTHLTDIFETIKYSVESLRSAQSRNALFCICDLFQHFEDKDALVQNVASLLNSLVIKGTNEKRFIAQAGEEAIETIVTSAPSAQVLNALLEFSSSKSTKICALVAKYSLLCLNGIAAQHKLKSFVADDRKVLPLIRGFTDLESSRSVQAKKPAHAALKLIASAMEGKAFEALVKKELSPVDASRVISMVKQGSKPKEARSASLREMMAKQRQTMARTNGI